MKCLRCCSDLELRRLTPTTNHGLVIEVYKCEKCSILIKHIVEITPTKNTDKHRFPSEIYEIYPIITSDKKECAE